MRRKDREILDIEEIFEMLTRCDTIRIGMSGEKYPYIVPVSFGAEMDHGKPVVFFHCAQQGMKLDLIRANPRVCVEGDIFIKIETTAHGITARYESVIGFGECQIVTDRDEMIHGLQLLTAHYGYDDYPIERCRGIEHLCIWKIVLSEVTGKRNLPGEPTTADKYMSSKHEKPVK